MEEKQLIQQELQELAPALMRISRTMPFSVPDKYFVNVSEKIKETVDPVLPAGELVSGYPFSVPENYFEHLSSKVMERTGTLEQKYGLSFSKRIIKWMPYAAAAVVGGILVYSAILFNTPSSNTEAFQPATDYSAMESSVASHTILTPDNEVYRAIAQKMRGVSDEEMNTYLEENISSETTEWIPDEMN